MSVGRAAASNTCKKSLCNTDSIKYHLLILIVSIYYKATIQNAQNYLKDYNQYKMCVDNNNYDCNCNKTLYCSQ